MKYFTLTLLYLTSLYTFGQDNNALSNNTESVFNSTSMSLGVTTSIVNPKRPVDGSVYLFDSWYNQVVIVTTDNQKLKVDNINLNVDRNVFESKFAGDSLFTYSFNNIDKFVVNNKEFRNYYWKDDNRVYQLLFDSEEFSVIKGFKITVLEGSPNPMLNRTRDKYVLKESYYIKRKNSIKPFRLSRGKILKLLDLNKEDKNRLMDYVDERNLSFKDEVDINSILGYGQQLKS